MEKKTVLQQLIERQESDIKDAEQSAVNYKLLLDSKMESLWREIAQEKKLMLIRLKSYLSDERAMLEDAYMKGNTALYPTQEFIDYYSQFLTQPTQNER